MRIALLGLGLIGTAWSRHWHTDGHDLRTWNRTPKPDAPGFQADLAEAVRDAEVVAIVVSDGPAVLDLVARIAPHLAPGAVVCQHSTIGRDECLAAAASVHAAGGRFLDMPFTGSKTASEQRQVVWYVGGDPVDQARVEPLYRPLARALLLVGPVGHATALKLCMNLNIAGVYQALCEALTTADRAGIERSAFFQALDLNVSRSGLVDLKRPKLDADDWSPHFAVKHMHKDLRLALRLAAEADLDLPGTAEVERAYARAEALGLADSDFASLVEVVRRQA